jgi:hypothetical protein
MSKQVIEWIDVKTEISDLLAALEERPESLERTQCLLCLGQARMWAGTAVIGEQMTGKWEEK